LGYSDIEFKRLELQGAFFRDFTEDVLRRAGIAPGMRVLDIGCGVGDVALLAGELVGPSGAVLAVDRSADALGIARRRAALARQPWVRFAAAELDTFSPDGTFDAVIGRLVLMYLPDPEATLRRLCRHLRPGGVVAFQEVASGVMRSFPEGPEYRRWRGWILDTFERSGCDPNMGGKLLSTFIAAGLPAPEMIAAGRVGGGLHSPIYEYLADLLRSMLPMTEVLGVATRAEVDIDTLAERLRREALEQNASLMGPVLIGAWSRAVA
jgi:SAM-dependent methyltransferase